MNSKDSDNFFENVLPAIIDFAVALPEVVNQPIPHLPAGSEQSVLLSQHQICCLLANSFLCTFPSSYWRDGGTYPSINFTRLFDLALPANVEKIACVVHYFSVLAERKKTGSDKLQQTVIYQRRIGAPPPADAAARAVAFPRPLRGGFPPSSPAPHRTGHRGPQPLPSPLCNRSWRLPLHSLPFHGVPPSPLPFGLSSVCARS